jgi:hypothetical protein
VAYFLTIGAAILTTEASSNRTRVRITINLNWDTAQSWFGSSTSGTWGISGDGTSGGGPFTGPSSGGSGSAGDVQVLSYDAWVSHNANGVLGTLTFSGTFTGSGGGSPGALSASTTLGGFTDFDRSPSDPTFASLTRTVDAVAVSVNAVSSPAGTATYVITRSENGGAYGDTRSSTSRSATFSGLLKGSTQQFRVLASNSDGSSAVTTSSTVSIPNVPTAPSITTTAPSGRALNVSSGVSSANGATVTGYFVQLSADDGVTWETAISIPSRAYRFEDLAGGTNVKFRVYSENEMGFSAFTVTDSIFIPSGGRRLTADGFISTQTFTRLTASGPVPVGIAKRLTASGWVELS